MPLYTYIVTYNDSSYIGQGSHSNYCGFISDWCTNLPNTALNGFNSNLKKELERVAYQGAFDPVPNRKNVWKKTIDLNGKPFIIYAVETKN